MSSRTVTSPRATGDTLIAVQGDWLPFINPSEDVKITGMFNAKWNKLVIKENYVKRCGNGWKRPIYEKPSVIWARGRRRRVENRNTSSERGQCCSANGTVHILMQAADANSSGHTESSSISCHMFPVSIEDHNFNSSHKTFNRPLNGAPLTLFKDGTSLQCFSSPCKD